MTLQTSDQTSRRSDVVKTILKHRARGHECPERIVSHIFRKFLCDAAWPPSLYCFPIYAIYILYENNLTVKNQYGLVILLVDNTPGLENLTLDPFYVSLYCVVDLRISHVRDKTCDKRTAF